jgi:hypothetical protein
MEAIDWNNRIFTIRDFVSSEEITALKAAGHDALTKEAGGNETIWKKGHVYSTVVMSNGDYKRHAILDEFERRVALLTMIPTHKNELPIMITRQQPGLIVGDVVDNQVVRNIHHDKNKRSNRVVTVLVYLNTIPPKNGGRTLFPCIASKHGRKSLEGKQKHESFVKYFSEHYHSGRRVLDADHINDQSLPIFEACNAECLLADKSNVLSIQPEKGTALVFWHSHADGQPNPLIWHTACQTLAGNEPREAVQKFKEFPEVSGVDLESVLKAEAADRKVWAAYTDDDGRTYYHNEVTGDTTWDKPPGFVQADAP